VELSAAQRRIAFAVVVFVLAGLGVYLLTSGGGGTHPGAAATPPPRHHATSAASPVTTTSPAASPTASAAAGQAPDIYQWLPFTPAGLASAVSVTTRFGDAYGTFTYTENTAHYVATMAKLVTSQLSGQIAAAYSAPGVASLRTSRKQVSAGTAAITSIRAFGPTSITFLVTITERITATQDGGPSSTSYAVTVSGGDASWQVSGIELASQGNS
jgi:hypothetical protein